VFYLVVGEGDKGCDDDHRRGHRSSVAAAGLVKMMLQRVGKNLPCAV